MGNCGGRERVYPEGANEPSQEPIIRHVEIVRGPEGEWVPQNTATRILPIDIRRKSQKGAEGTHPKKPGF